jgi:hypothetical protein
VPLHLEDVGHVGVEKELDPGAPLALGVVGEHELLAEAILEATPAQDSQGGGGEWGRRTAGLVPAAGRVLAPGLVPAAGRVLAPGGPVPTVPGVSDEDDRVAGRRPIRGRQEPGAAAVDAELEAREEARIAVPQAQSTPVRPHVSQLVADEEGGPVAEDDAGAAISRGDDWWWTVREPPLPILRRWHGTPRLAR